MLSAAEFYSPQCKALVKKTFDTRYYFISIGRSYLAEKDHFVELYWSWPLFFAFSPLRKDLFPTATGENYCPPRSLNFCE